MHNNGVKKTLKDIYEVMNRHKRDYMRQIVYGEDNRYLYTDMCEDIERHAEPFVMRLVRLEKLEINDAKQFLASLYDMAVDIHLEGLRNPWWYRVKKWLRGLL